MRFLIPVDGSECSRRAIEHAIRLARCPGPPEIHVLHVRPPVDAWEVRSFLSDEEIEQTQQHEGEASLREARDLLDAAGVAYHAHVAVGPIPETIARFADENACDLIVMGTHGRGGLSQILLGSVATQVVHLSHVPVTLVK
jgi:nucleotide-binding universal stress UspA family protein